MKVNINTIRGKILDQSSLLSAYREDIDNTITNANQTLNALISISDIAGENIDQISSLMSDIPTPVQVSIPNVNVDTSAADALAVWFIDKDPTTQLPVIGKYAEGGFQKVDDIFTVTESGVIELVHDVDEQSANISGTQVPTISGLTYAVTDTLGQATLLSRLASLIASGREDVLTPFVNLTNATISGATENTQLLYESIVDALTQTQNSVPASFMVLQTIYSALGSVRAAITGEYYSFDKTNYHIQAYAASNMIQAVVSSVATVAGVLLAAVSPVVGMAVMLAPTIVGGIMNAINEVSENSTSTAIPDSANTLFNVPIWQGNITKNDYYTAIVGDTGVKYLEDVVDQYGVAVVNVPSLYLIVWNDKDHSDQWKVEAYLNCCVNNALRYNTFHEQTFSGYAGAASSFDLDNGCSWLSTAFFTTSNLSTRDTWQNSLDQGLSNNTDTISMNLVAHAFMSAIRIGATTKFGYNVTYSEIAESASCPDYWKALLFWINNWRTDSSYRNWEHIINGLIYGTIRNLTGSQFYDAFLQPYFRLSAGWLGEDWTVETLNDQNVITYLPIKSKREFVTISGGAPTRSDFFITAPKYSSRAMFNTIMIALGITVATTAAFVAATIVRVKIRNSQIKSYAKVAAAQQALTADPTNKDKLKAYVKAVKSYNMKSVWLGYSSRLNMIDGWQEAKGGSNTQGVGFSGLYQSIQDINKVNTATGVTPTTPDLTAQIEVIKSLIK